MLRSVRAAAATHRWVVSYGSKVRRKRTRDCALDAQRGWEARGVPAGGRLGSGSGDTIRLAWRERSCVASACAKPEGAVGNCVVIVDPWLSPAEDAKRRRRAHGN